MPQFSPDQTQRGARFSPATGNIGAQAAQKAARPAPAQRPGGQPSPSKRENPRLGHPTFPEEKPEGPRDNRHLEVIGQYFNMKPWVEGSFTTWGARALSRRWAKPGQVPYDIFDDTG